MNTISCLKKRGREEDWMQFLCRRFGDVHGGGSPAGAARSGTDLASLREPLWHRVEPLPPTRLRSRARPDTYSHASLAVPRCSCECVRVCGFQFNVRRWTSKWKT